MNWRRFFSRSDRLSELSREIEFHVQAETEENIARGMAAGEARLAARRKLGNTALIREDIYAMKASAQLEIIWQDIKYSLRVLRKNPVFTAAAILTLTLGIGANTAMFSLVRAVLLKPLEYHDPDRLVFLTLENASQNSLDLGFTQLRYEQTKKTARAFSSVACFLRMPENMILSGAGEPDALKGARVSANFLEVLGVAPIVGRSFSIDEDTPGGALVAMISASLWKNRFGADPQISGRPISLDAKPYTIIGVLPDGFDFPFAGVDVWVTKPTEMLALPAKFWPFITTQILFARTQPGITFDQAKAEMEVMNQQYMRANPKWTDAKPGTVVKVQLLRDRLVAKVRTMLWLLFGAVSCVLLIACANLGGLLLARASARTREFTVRAALGAGRGRLMRQLLTESMLLALIGGGSGVLLAQWILTAIPTIEARLPSAQGIKIDNVVLWFTLAISAVAGVLFGLLPSLAASRPNLVEALRQSGAASKLSLSWRRTVLVTGQVALSVVLLVGAALLIQSFARLRSVNPGFDAESLLTMKIPLPAARYDTREKRSMLFSEMERRVAALPGVKNVAIARTIPTTPWFFTNVGVEGQPEAEAREQPSAQLQSVTPDYFRAMRIPLHRGRTFTAQDNTPGSPPVFVINETFARRFWPSYPDGLNPVGQHMGEGIDKIVSAEIVGIVGDVHEGGLDVKPKPEFYVPIAVHAPQIAYLLIRTSGDPLQLTSTIRREVLAIDRDQPVTDVFRMSDVMDATLGRPRLTVLLLTAFAGTALLLALIGIYGLIAYSVTQRTQELGVRRALGAGPSNILMLVLKHALALTIAGVALGLVGSFALARLMKTLVFEVSTADPATFAFVALLFVIVGLAAASIPAWRAQRIDPATALREG